MQQGQVPSLTLGTEGQMMTCGQGGADKAPTNHLSFPPSTGLP